MTRREEIEQAAFNYINSDTVSPENMQLVFGDFINGAQWADKTMYERIIKWLFDYCPSTAKDPEFTIQNLKNAMEE